VWPYAEGDAERRTNEVDRGQPRGKGVPTIQTRARTNNESDSLCIRGLSENSDGTRFSSDAAAAFNRMEESRSFHFAEVHVRGSSSSRMIRSKDVCPVRSMRRT